MNVVVLTPRSLHRLSDLGRTEDPPRWVAEVEDFLLTDVPAQVGPAEGSIPVLVVDDEHQVVAAAAHRRHLHFNAEHLQAFVVAPRVRGRGLATPALRTVIDHVRASTSLEHVIWHVHVDNTPMRAVSEQVGEIVVTDDDYVTYCHP